MGPTGPHPGGPPARSLAGRACSAIPPPHFAATRRAGGGNGVRWQRLAVAGGCGVATLSVAKAGRSNRGAPVRSSANSNSITTFGNSQRRVTDSLIVINAMLFGLQAVSGQKLLLMGAKINSAISQGEWWRLMTAAFLHADILHLGFNCNALHQIGPMVEALSGSARFSVIYLGSAVAGNLASMALSPHMSVGASGAIFGVAASLAVFAYRHRALMGERADFLLKRLSDTAAINFMYGLIIRRIDNWGHLGGLLGGAALTYLLGPRLVAVRPRGTRNIQLVDRPPLPILADRRPERK